MKLIDLLVQELPKRGGWPDGADRCRVDNLDGDSITVSFCFPEGYSNGFDVPFQFSMTISIPGRNVIVATNYCMITRDLYEYALAASQKPAWNGEGVPPAGCECEFISNGTLWGKVKVIGLDGEKIVIRPSGEIYYAITPSNKDVFIPFRTEEERKRDIMVGAIKELFKCSNDPSVDDATLIFNAIAAGKIPGVKLED